MLIILVPIVLAFAAAIAAVALPAVIVTCFKNNSYSGWGFKKCLFWYTFSYVILGLIIFIIIEWSTNTSEFYDFFRFKWLFGN